MGQYATSVYSITATAGASGLQLIEIRETFHDL
jgi:hypothetical protein